jgi:hypothetical protein
LIATVTDASNNPVSGVSVTFTAPASGASGTFATATPGPIDTETTGSNGQAISKTFTANATTGGPYNVVATSGTLTPVNFAETNTVAVASSTYVFYASGEDDFGGFVNYYAIAGAVTIDANGNILGGEQDYNDAAGLTATDPISAANTALVVDPTTGQGTLTITTTDTNLGGVNTAAGVEEFAIQFVNPSHALIAQFDGSATSSGTLDLQTTTTAANGNYAFTLSGVDNTAPNTSYSSFAAGGVVTINGTTLTGVFDINDANTAIVATANPITAATLSATDSFGRGTITNSGIIASGTFAYYVVGPATGSQALRIIDIDTNDAAVGSAYGQGSATFTNASLTADVFTLLGQWSEVYATLGQFSTDSNGNITAGAADDNELDNGFQQVAVSVAGSTYDLTTSGTNGYGSVTMTGTGDVTTLGLYMVDPALNINDPNNTTSADVGGALLADLDSGLPGGTGIVTPQTDASVASFNGTYVAGFQNFNDFTACTDCEFDMISQGAMVTGAALNFTGSDSDPFGTWTGTPAESTGDIFTTTPLSVSPGIYSMWTGNTTANPIEATINLVQFGMDADIYQASGTTLYWLEFDNDGVFLGPIVAQGSLTGIPAAKKPAGQPQLKQNTKPVKSFGGRLH